MTRQYLLVTASILMQTSLCSAAASPIKQKKIHDTRRSGVIPGAWIIGNQTKLTTHFAQTKPTHSKLTVPSTTTLISYSKPECPDHKIITPGRTHIGRGTKRKLVNLSTPSTPASSTTPLLEFDSAMSPEQTMHDESTSESDTPSSPVSSTSSETSLPPSPIKLGREEAMFQEGPKNIEEISLIEDDSHCDTLKRAFVRVFKEKRLYKLPQKNAKRTLRNLQKTAGEYFTQLQQEEELIKKQRSQELNVLARDIKTFFKQLDRETEMTSIAAEAAIVTKEFNL